MEDKEERTAWPVACYLALCRVFEMDIEKTCGLLDPNGFLFIYFGGEGMFMFFVTRSSRLAVRTTKSILIKCESARFWTAF